MNSASKPYGMIAEFTTAADILHAAEKVRDAGFTRWDVFTPFPVHGMDGAMGMRNSKVGWFSFLGGVTGYTSGHVDDLVHERRTTTRSSSAASRCSARSPPFRPLMN